MAHNLIAGVLSFGGFLHFGESHFPVPCAALSYNAVLQAYEVDITDEQLHDAPFCVGDLEFDWGDRSREASIHKVYRSMACPDRPAADIEGSSGSTASWFRESRRRH
jgi:hypothetical protein